MCMYAHKKSIFLIYILKMIFMNENKSDAGIAIGQIQLYMDIGLLCCNSEEKN